MSDRWKLAKFGPSFGVGALAKSAVLFRAEEKDFGAKCGEVTLLLTGYRGSSALDGRSVPWQGSWKNRISTGGLEQTPVLLHYCPVVTFDTSKYIMCTLYCINFWCLSVKYLIPARSATQSGSPLNFSIHPGSAESECGMQGRDPALHRAPRGEVRHRESARRLLATDMC